MEYIFIIVINNIIYYYYWCSSGRNYDKDGKLNQWWTPTSIENFISKAECIENQYGNYTVKAANMNVRILY